MSSSLQIGITGGIGSGKSLICEMFVHLGVPVYNADDRAKWLMNNGKELKSSMIEAFGDEAYKTDGTLNRDYIAASVFKDEEKLATLNSIVHPAVGIDYSNWVASCEDNDYVIKEAALMFKSGSYKMLDKVITVAAPEQIRIARIRLRDSFRSEDEIKSIINRQIKDEERIERSDYVINNDETIMLIPQVLRLHQMFSQKQ